MTVKAHLLKRRCDPLNYSVWLDEAERCAYFPLWNLTGQMVGYQKYSPWAPKNEKNNLPPGERKYYTYLGKEGDEYPKNGKHKVGFFGLDKLKASDKTVVVVEGVFDAIRLINEGVPTLALLSNDPKRFRPFFRALNKRVVAVCDNDTAGRKLAKIGTFSLTCSEKDVDDMSDKEFSSLLDMLKGLS